MIRKAIQLVNRSLIILVAALLSLILAAPFYLYHRFDSEYPIAKLSFHQLGHQQYIAELRTGDFCLKDQPILYGDQWRIDAAFVKWKGLGVTLGFEPKYRLERLTGRYRDTDEQNSKKTLAHDLTPEVWLDIFDDRKLDGTGNLLVDTVFGSSVYLDIDTQKLYLLYMTEDALVVKAQDKPKVQIEKGIATIEINNACAKEPELIDTLARKVNHLAVQFL